MKSSSSSSIFLTIGTFLLFLLLWWLLWLLSCFFLIGSNCFKFGLATTLFFFSATPLPWWSWRWWCCFTSLMSPCFCWCNCFFVFWWWRSQWPREDDLTPLPSPPLTNCRCRPPRRSPSSSEGGGSRFTRLLANPSAKEDQDVSSSAKIPSSKTKSLSSCQRKREKIKLVEFFFLDSFHPKSIKNQS